jgi:hypothetical protein
MATVEEVLPEQALAVLGYQDSAGCDCRLRGRSVGHASSFRKSRDWKKNHLLRNGTAQQLSYPGCAALISGEVTCIMQATHSI